MMHSEKEMKSHLAPSKAKKMLKEGIVHGKKITGKQKKFFGLIAGGGMPSRLKK